MTTFHFYDEASGEFVGRTFSGPASALALNTPSGCLAWQADEAQLELLEGKRVDISTHEQLLDAEVSAPPPVALPLLKQLAMDAIDQVAGAARLKYITDVAGQSAVYLVKAQQAEAYQAAGFVGAVPPYILAESAALNVSPQIAAEGILTVAGVWNGQAGPAIEGLRIGAKTAVNAAPDAEAVAQIRDQALTQLGTV